MKNRLLVIGGPTASGKTSLAIALAKSLSGELISADSRQVYKFMDISTGKDRSFPTHLIGFYDPRYQRMNVAIYQKLARQLIEEINRKNKLPILVGGTGLYIEAVIKGYEFPAGKRYRGEFMGRAQPPGYDLLMLGIELDRQTLYRRIDERIEERLANGMIEEVKHLRQLGLSDDQLAAFGLELRYINRFLIGQSTKAEMIAQLKSASHAYARRQLTWFRRYNVLPDYGRSGYSQPENKAMVWVRSKEEAVDRVRRWLGKGS